MANSVYYESHGIIVTDMLLTVEGQDYPLDEVLSAKVGLKKVEIARFVWLAVLGAGGALLSVGATILAFFRAGSDRFAAAVGVASFGVCTLVALAGWWRIVRAEPSYHVVVTTTAGDVVMMRADEITEPLAVVDAIQAARADRCTSPHLE